MKKSIILSILGVTAAALTSYGQGNVNFTSYYANGGAGAATYVFGTSIFVPDGYNVDLYYAFGTTSDTVASASPNSVAAVPSGMTDLGVTGLTTYSGGYFGNPIVTVTIPGYTSGAITFEVVAFNGADYASSTIRGRSGSFTMASIATGANPVPALTGLPDFYVAPVPEPTTLALAGLSGLALFAFRRKQS